MSMPNTNYLDQPSSLTMRLGCERYDEYEYRYSPHVNSGEIEKLRKPNINTKAGYSKPLHMVSIIHK
jgi:hypothetical protein